MLRCAAMAMNSAGPSEAQDTAGALSQFVRTRRAALGLTQEAAAEKAHIGVSTWRLLEKGDTSGFRGLTLARAAQALDVPADYLLSVAGQTVAAHPGAAPWGARGTGVTSLSAHAAPDAAKKSIGDVVWRIAPKIAQLDSGDARLVETLVDRLLAQRPASDEGENPVQPA